MSDRHLRILRAVAARRRRDLADHDAGAAPGAPATARRRDLVRSAVRTRARVAAAQARRGSAGDEAP